MKLKTILKLALRCFAILVLCNCFVSGMRLLSFLFLSSDAREMQMDEVYVELARSILGLIFGIGVFRFADRLTAVFGKDYDFDEKLEVMGSSSMFAAIYAVFGVWLIVFSVPDLLEEIIRLQTSYYGAAVNDINTAILKYSIAGDLSRVIIGVALIKFPVNMRNWMPPLNRWKTMLEGTKEIAGKTTEEYNAWGGEWMIFPVIEETILRLAVTFTRNH